LSPLFSEFHYSIFFHESSGSDFAHIFCAVAQHLADDNPCEKHAGGAQADAAEFQTAQRHSEYTDKGERADGVCNGLRLVELEKPAHALTSRALRL
jgi:hypothetical protein